MKRLPAIRELLLGDDYDALTEAAAQEGGRTASALIGLLVEPDEGIKWRAVKALGLVGRSLYLQEPERLRKVLRQLIWNLNQESGGIGWGMAEGFGEILALVPEMKEEYEPLLVAYLAEEACRPGNPDLVKGVVWALGRAKIKEPDLKATAVPFLLALLDDPDPALKGLSAWALGEIKAPETRSKLKGLQTKNQMIKIYTEGRLEEKSLSQWIKQAIEKLNQDTW